MPFSVRYVLKASAMKAALWSERMKDGMAKKLSRHVMTVSLVCLSQGYTKGNLKYSSIKERNYLFLETVGKALKINAKSLKRPCCSI